MISEPQHLKRPITVALLVHDRGDPKQGGGYTAEAMTADLLRKSVSSPDTLFTVRIRNEGIFFSKFRTLEPTVFLWQRTWFTRISSRLFRSQLLHRLQTKGFFLPPGGLERHLLRKQVSLVVLSSPSISESDWIGIPYWIPCWDLGHIEFPDLPETGLGRQFEKREAWHRRVLPKASLVMAESQEGKDRIVRVYGLEPNRVVVIPFVAPDWTFSEVPRTDRESYAFYPAQFWPHKNHAVLLAALRRILDSGDIPRPLLFSGADKGNLTAVKNLVRSLHLDDYVTFCGFLDLEGLKKTYLQAGLLVMPSLLGPTNLPPIEAAAMGCPVAISRCEGIIRKIEKEIEVIDYYDVEGWARILGTRFTPKVVNAEAFRNLCDRQNAENVSLLAGCLKNYSSARALM